VIERSAFDLKFVIPRNSIPTVEVDLDAIPDELQGYGDLVAKALQPFASKFPKTIASIHVYQGSSVNFGTVTFSAFFGVAGRKDLLAPLLRAFAKVAGTRTRFSDYIDPSQGICEFHIQDGCVWRPCDGLTWYTEMGETLPSEVANSISESAEEPEDVEIDRDEANEKTKVNPDVASRVFNPARFRAARADARVGKIRKTIEEVFGLPEGSVALCGPDGKALRSNATIATLRNRWE
jgi:hypothetical protein